jgi:hypothetical protein
MAIIRQLQARLLEKDSRHTEPKCTSSIVTHSDGTKLLQIGTYRSKDRKFSDKASQSIRFSKEAFEQLKTILHEHFH